MAAAAEPKETKCACSKVPKLTLSKLEERRQALNQTLEEQYVAIGSTAIDHQQPEADWNNFGPDVAVSEATVRRLLHFLSVHARPSLERIRCQDGFKKVFTLQQRALYQDVAPAFQPAALAMATAPFIPVMWFQHPYGLVQILKRLVNGEVLGPEHVGLTFATEETAILQDAVNECQRHGRLFEDVVCMVILEYKDAADDIKKQAKTMWFDPTPKKSWMDAVYFICHHQQMLNDPRAQHAATEWTKYDDQLYIDFQATFPDLDVADLSTADREELVNARTTRMDAFIVKWSRLIPDALEPVAVRTRASDRQYALDDKQRAIPVCRLIWYCIEIMRGRLGMNDLFEPGK